MTDAPGLAAAWPQADLVIAAGRQSIAPARAIAKKRRGGRPLVAVMQPVAWRPDQFDLIWAPLHDRAGANLFGAGPLVETLTAPSAVTAAAMAEAAAWLQSAQPIGPPPFVGVLVGGPSRAHRFGAPEVDELAARLAAFATAHDVTMLVSTSRRTPRCAAAVLRARLGAERQFVFDAVEGRAELGGRDQMIYPAILGLAQALVVTDDSFAMMSEAAATGSPIYGWRLPGGKAKFDRFYRGLEAHGALRWFDGSFERWTYPPLDAAQTIADALIAKRPLAGADMKRI